MSEIKNEELDCMFTDAEAASFCLLIQSYGLRSTRLAEFPFKARIGVADLEEQVHRSFMNHLYFIDKNKPDDVVVELVKNKESQSS